MDIKENKKIASEINECMKKYNFLYVPNFEWTDLMTTSNIITNIGTSTKLTDVIFDNYFSKKPMTEYHHFTNILAFENILKTKKLWLFSVEKRFTEDEFKPFYKTHKMDGYEKRMTQNGEPLEKELVKNAFYISFTNGSLSKEDEDQMWDSFSETKGVRLVFEIEKSNTQYFRKIFYPQSSERTDLPLLTDLISIANERKKKMILEKIATIGFFYLPSKFNKEQEYRLLVKRELGEQNNFNFGEKDGFEYMKFPFNDTNPIVELKLKKIIFNKNTDKVKVIEIIKSNPDFMNVTIENN